MTSLTDSKSGILHLVEDCGDITDSKSRILHLVEDCGDITDSKELDLERNRDNNVTTCRHDVTDQE